MGLGGWAFEAMFFLVPSCFILVAVVGVFRNARLIHRVIRLNREGERATGEVISSRVFHEWNPAYNAARSTVVETIEYLTPVGVIRGAPLHSDVGQVDRSGEVVPVLYDRHHPDRFIAPADGRGASYLSPGFTAALFLAMGAFGVLFILVTCAMADFPA